MDISIQTWQDLFKLVIMAATAIAGAPITQVLKNWLKVKDKTALLLALAVSAVVAVAEMWLSGKLVFSDITLNNFPAVFSAVFAVATVYYNMLKDSDTPFGKKFLLKG